MPVSITQVDAFTDTAFRGNPAAICVLDDLPDEHWMQNVASEMNLSESAFVWPEGQQWRLRWFTPHQEIGLCGHATLAAAHVLWESQRIAQTQPIAFNTCSGPLFCHSKGNHIEMDFPAKPATITNSPEGLLDALEAVPLQILKSELDYMAVLSSEAEVLNVDPNTHLLERLPSPRGIIITARAYPEKPYDFVSRFFLPKFGVPEDPVTGSAHCTLAPYWCERLGRDELIGYQASRRGGFVRVKNQGKRVLISGQAITVMHIQLLA